jgi:hypothetical protein
MDLSNSKPTTDNSTLEGIDADPKDVGGISWHRMYAIVLGELALLIALFYLFTKIFA